MFLRVATVNILNDLSRWDERRTLLAEGLDALSPDLIALQEVTDPLGTSTAHWLAGELGGYSVHVCPKTGWGRKREGIAVLSRLPVEGHEILDLGSQQRTAQFLRVRAGGRPVVLVNGHYHWLPGAHAAQGPPGRAGPRPGEGPRPGDGGRRLRGLQRHAGVAGHRPDAADVRLGPRGPPREGARVHLPDAPGQRGPGPGGRHPGSAPALHQPPRRLVAGHASTTSS